MPKQKKPWHMGSFQRRGDKIKAAAQANPQQTCWRCGGYARPNDPWVAGHLIDSLIDGPLAPEHRSCNSRAGQRYGARLRKQRTIQRTNLTW